MRDFIAIISWNLLGLATYLAAVSIIRRYRKRISSLWDREVDLNDHLADMICVKIPKWMRWMLPAMGPLARFSMEMARRRRERVISLQLVDLLALMQNCLKAGLSIAQTIEMASIESPEPLASELRIVVAKIMMGSTIEDGLAQLSQRVRLDDVKLIVQSVDVLRRTGGNMIDTFAVLMNTIESRQRVERRARALTAQGRTQGAILIAMPMALAITLNWISPDYMEPLFKTRLGWFFIGCAALLESIGALWLWKILNIKV